MNYYDSIANSYDSLYGEEQLSKWNKCMDLIKIKGLVLDAGCGTGVITRMIPNIIGCDSSIRMLRKCSDLSVVCANLTDLPFKSKSFDTIVSFTVLQDINDCKMAASELRRVLKKKGSLLVTVLDKNKISLVREALLKNFKNIKEKSIGKDAVFFT